MVDEMGGDLPALPNPIKQKPIYLFIHLSLSLFLKRRKNKEPSRRKEANRSRTVYITTWGKREQQQLRVDTQTQEPRRINTRVVLICESR